MSDDKGENIMEVAKRRGFIWPSFEPYGGLAGFYDLGPLGSLLKEKIIQKWRQYYVDKRGLHGDRFSNDFSERGSRSQRSRGSFHRRDGRMYLLWHSL